MAMLMAIAMLIAITVATAKLIKVMINVYKRKNTIGGAITTVGGSTTCAAAISDVVKGPELAGAMGNLGSYAGLGVLVGPFISGQILAATNKVRYTYFGRTIQFEQQMMEETAS